MVQTNQELVKEVLDNLELLLTKAMDDIAITSANKNELQEVLAKGRKRDFLRAFDLVKNAQNTLL